jgi:hypothetical protein
METTRSPDPIPSAYTAKLELIVKNARALMDLKGLPYFVQAALADSGYTTLEDLADRWDTPQDARTKGPKALGFEDGNNNYTKETEEFTAMKLYQVVKAAKLQTSGMSGVTVSPQKPSSGVTVSPMGNLDHTYDRDNLIQIYMAKTGLPKPSLEVQGSDSLLKAQLRHCSQGTIGFIHSKHIISFLPEEGERPFKKRRLTLSDSYIKDEEEEERQQPQNRRQLERMHNVFQTSLLMCIFAFPQFQQFNITKQDMDSWYSWFHGPSMANRDPMPPAHVLLQAERNAWREILKLMYEGQDLKTAMSDVKKDLLFWQREVYEKLQRSSSKGSKPTKGNYKGGGKRSYSTPQFQPRPTVSPMGTSNSPRKGVRTSKGKPKGKGKGKKGKPTQWPSGWATTNPKGVAFCRNYHLTGSCSGQCGRSHNCPVMKKDGWICNAAPESHGPSSCPHK